MSGCISLTFLCGVALVPLAEPKYHGGGFSHWAEVHPPSGTWEQGAAVCPGVQGGPDHRRSRSLYFLGNGELCKTRGQPAHEYYLETGTADSGEVFEEDK